MFDILVWGFIMFGFEDLICVQDLNHGLCFEVEFWLGSSLVSDLNLICVLIIYLIFGIDSIYFFD